MIALIDYGAGNTASVANALEDIGTDFKIVKSEIPICNSDKIIEKTFPWYLFRNADSL
jgi:imidazoleglycerol phosphate synthase glutamine amidotransferase subunit HisH